MEFAGTRSFDHVLVPGNFFVNWCKVSRALGHSSLIFNDSKFENFPAKAIMFNANYFCPPIYIMLCASGNVLISQTKSKTVVPSHAGHERITEAPPLINPPHQRSLISNNEYGSYK